MKMTNEEVIKALEKYKSRYTQCAADAEANEVIDKSIEALKREPCTDAVSREEALEAFKPRGISQDAWEESNVYKTIKALPTVTPETKSEWIPVSERLPDDSMTCYVTVEKDDRNGEPQRVIYPEFVGYDGETWVNRAGEVIPFDVIAWKELSKPYREVSE